MDYKVALMPLDKNHIFTNCIVFAEKTRRYARVGDTIYVCDSSDEARVATTAAAEKTVQMSAVQREASKVSLGDVARIEFFDAPPPHLNVKKVDTIYVSVASLNAHAPVREIRADHLMLKLVSVLNDHILGIGQAVIIEMQGKKVIVTVTLENDAKYSLVHVQTIFKLSSKSIALIGNKEPMFTNKFENLGIGGLEKQFASIFRRVFTSRSIPHHVITKMNIKHVKGMLLYGPPGTGKTLLARQIGQMLKCVTPIIVNGPEILNKYVGQSEENIRNLFKCAEKEQAESGVNSKLHLIIFDEIDAICKRRGSTDSGTGTNDSIVNQLLSKMDGVNSLENILVIGMTNRRDMIDDALLRPGRFEVQIELNLPDEEGREQILRIHTRSMRQNELLHESVDLAHLSQQTRNYSGAELEGLVKSASSLALLRAMQSVGDVESFDEKALVIKSEDFEGALADVRPAFGAAAMNDAAVSAPLKIESLDALVAKCASLLDRGEALETVLLEGNHGCGKTSIAMQIVARRSYPYVRVISPEKMVGHSEQAKLALITKVFEDSYKSPCSCIVLDDLERLIEYVRVGPRFSNAILQCLLVLVKKQPPAGHRLLVVGTTSIVREMEPLELSEAFQNEEHVPQITAVEKVKICIERGVDMRHIDTLREQWKLEQPLKSFLSSLGASSLGAYGTNTV